MAVHSLDAQKNTLKAIETDLTTSYLQQLESLEQRSDTALGAAEETLDTLESRASQLTNDFIEAVHQLRDAVDHSRQNADGLVQTAVSLLSETKTHVDELNKKREADLAELQQLLQQLEHSYQQIETEASSALAGVVQHASPLMALFAQGTSQVHEHGEQLGQSLQAVEHAFAEDVKNMASALHDLAQHIQQEQDQHDHAQEQHATNTHAQTQQLVAQNLATLTAGMQGVGNAFSTLTEYGEHLGGAFGDGSKGLLDTVSEIGHIVDAIKPVLDVIKAIE